jgi:hypothetical protein
MICAPPRSIEQATSIAKAAEACAESGNAQKAIEIALDIEQMIYEVNTLLNGAGMINRIGNRSVNWPS